MQITHAPSDPTSLPPARPIHPALIAARVPADIAEGSSVGHHLAIASELTMPKPTVRQRLASKLRSLVGPSTTVDIGFDTGGYYPVRRPGRAASAERSLV